MKIKKILGTGFTFGVLAFASPKTLANDKCNIINNDIATTATINISSSNLERILWNNSASNHTTFILTKKIPDILISYEGKNRKELINKYNIMWNYGVNTTYYVIEKMRTKSKNSQRKVEHFGFEDYLKDNLSDKIDGLDYALELHLRRMEPDIKRIKEIAQKSQQRKNGSGDNNPAPIIGINPVDYTSKECIDTRKKISIMFISDLRYEQVPIFKHIGKTI